MSASPCRLGRSRSPNARWSINSRVRPPKRRALRAAMVSRSDRVSARPCRWHWWTARCAPANSAKKWSLLPRTKNLWCRIPTMCRRPVSSSTSSCRTTWTSSPNSACCASCARNFRKRPELRRPCRRPRNECASLQLRLSRRADQADDPPRDPQSDRDPRLPGAVRQPRNADALWLGDWGCASDGGDPRPRRRVEGDRPGFRRHHQRDLDPQVFRQDRRCRDDDLDGAGDDNPDPSPHSRSDAAWRAGAGLSGADPRAAAFPRATRDRDAAHACARRIRADARQALRGHRPLRPYRHLLCLSGEGQCALCDGSITDAEIRQSEDGQLSGAATVRRGAREAHLCDSTLYVGVSLDFEDHPFTRYRFDAPCALCCADDSYLDEIVTDDKGSRMFVCSDTDFCETRQTLGHRGAESAAPHKERAHG